MWNKFPKSLQKNLQHEHFQAQFEETILLRTNKFKLLNLSQIVFFMVYLNTSSMIFHITIVYYCYYLLLLSFI